MRVPPSQSETRPEAMAERLLAVPELQRARDAREPRADGEHLDAVGRAHQGVGEAQVRVGARLHRARHVDEQQNGAAAQAAHEARQAEDLAVVADRLLHGAAQVEAGAALGRDAPVAAPQRQALGQRALEAAQRVGLVRLGEAAHGQRLGCRRGLTGLVDVVGGGRLEAAAAVLLHAQVVGVGLGRSRGPARRRRGSARRTAR